MKKTEKEVIKRLESELLNIENLYKSNCVNWCGKTKDTKIYTTEIISNRISKKLFNEIKEIERKETYYTNNHDGKIHNNSNRHEENFAKQITGMTLKGLGHIMDYQVPLKNIKSDNVGKLDLISFDIKTMSLYLIELKYGKNKETLLRAILESYTYFKIVKANKLIEDYLEKIISISKEGINPSEINVKPAVLLISDCKAYMDLAETSAGKRPELKKLINNLGVSCFAGEFELEIKNINIEEYTFKNDYSKPTH
ncbi:hypothetical protein [Algibacter mikhailovii]|uniref:hypothetical protein n=1 Tax=Algibacter mikhailovii TaxID=425498 RepID=UPI00249513A4|nr:hypothetical protein [Algibacter mikhailovii]